MATVITSGVDYARFFDDLRAVIRQEIKQARLIETSEELLVKNSEGSVRIGDKHEGSKEVAHD
ncbi:hypothetical protein [Hymenobacter defluvii]|uniref:Uncharacterized protein n=1 Tax=Hymenobacter defluvii TaxID=2054411 RepID=A0ABS3THS7_9BACT|nr:hypothetical protein [Hymenobacter defluvii]MBO3273202.1 hypothetical protein [Hymenobacter defluvii]